MCENHELQPAVSHDENRVVRVESHVVEPGLLPRHHWLGADGVVLVQVEVEHVDLRKSCKRLREYFLGIDEADGTLVLTYPSLICDLILYGDLVLYGGIQVVPPL